jgi:hypothetical protein
MTSPPQCTCNTFRQLGKCSHTGYNSLKEREARVELLNAQQPVSPVKASRTMPDAFVRRADFLDWCEEVKPGSSGITGEWH